VTSAYTSPVVSRPAVFMDRDGTLTEEVGYVNHPGRLPLHHVATSLLEAVEGIVARPIT
jgi:histidinol phosphatase-like enzyme